jgi:hypothetical protein
MKRVNKIFENKLRLLYSFFFVFFLILADVANIEQASLCIRYVLNDQIHEKFLMFTPVDDRSGAGLANLIIKAISDLGRNRIVLIEKTFHYLFVFRIRSSLLYWSGL